MTTSGIDILWYTSYDDQAYAYDEIESKISLDASGVKINRNLVGSTIVAEGSDYIKLANGTLICWGQVDCGSNAQVVVNYPIVYTAKPFVFVNSNKTGNSKDNAASCILRTTTSATLRQCNTASNLCWLSIGK